MAARSSNQPPGDPQLIVFDWDGTLADSMGHIVSVVQATARDLGWPEPSAEQIRPVVGLSLEKAVAETMPRARPEDVRAFIEAYRERYLSDAEGAGRLFPGVPRLLAELEAAGYWLVVATGKGRAGLDAALHASGVARHFLATRTADEARSKPHPAMLEDLLEYTGLESRQALMVGDSRFDLEMATNAGVDSVGVLGGAHDRSSLEACRPRAIIEEVTELRALLQISPD